MNKYVKIHSARENKDREMISLWCAENFKQGTWSIYSDYRKEGCFSLRFNSAAIANFYMLKWGGFVIETDKFTDLFGIE